MLTPMSIFPIIYTVVLYIDVSFTKNQKSHALRIIFLRSMEIIWT